MQDSTLRLGAGKNRDLDIRNHKFYAKINWKDLLEMKIYPPYRPIVLGDKDTSNFDKEFTDLCVDDSVKCDNVDETTENGKSNFDGFSYVAPGISSSNY